MDMGKVQSVLSRYTTPQFRNDPVGSVAKLLGLHSHKNTIRSHEEVAFPAMCGIIMYRHLDRGTQAEVNKMIIQEVPRGPLTSSLMGLVGEVKAAPRHYAWSLSDDELRAQLETSRSVKEILGALGVVASTTPTVAGTAKMLYDASQRGARATARSSVSTRRITEAAQKIGITKEGAKGLGLLTFIALAAGTVVHASAKSDEERALRELGLRNLVLLED